MWFKIRAMKKFFIAKTLLIKRMIASFSFRRKLMAHEDAGNYAAKHPAGRKPLDSVQESVQSSAKNGTITCVAAHRIAESCGTSPAEVGFTIDYNEYRITRCQLGLFGYAPEKRLVTPAETVSEELEKILRSSLNGKGRLTCSRAWEIAAAQGMKRIDISAACEKLEIRITACQLGAFR
ncbi:MAG TPA: hypothetical protein PLT75_02220 [Spirochaetota bacterium]|nr:hypothetical protein [Spirochaetota bacterium]